MLTQQSAEHTHHVLVNSEDQYSLWPGTKAVPHGWSIVASGSKDECLARIEDLWTDMRPKSVRAG